MFFLYNKIRVKGDKMLGKIIAVIGDKVKVKLDKSN